MENKTIIFDFDGTLADSVGLMIDLYNKHSEQFGYKKLQKNELQELQTMNYFKVIKIKQIKLHLIPKILLFMKKEMKKRISEVKPHPGIKEVLKKLKKDGCYVGVLTSNNKSLVEKFFKLHNVPEFDFVVSENSLFGKDNALKRIIKKRSLLLSEVLYVGDETRDVIASNKVGINVIGVEWGISGEKGLAMRNPDRIVKDSKELYRAIVSVLTSDGMDAQ